MGTAAVAIRLAIALLLAYAASAGASTGKGQPPIDAAPSTLLPGARDAGARVLNFLSTAPSTAAFTPKEIGHAMGVTLSPDADNDAGWAVYRSPDLGHGWTYGVQFAVPEAKMKPGFRFWLYNADRSADAAPVCVLPLDHLRGTLAAHGWIERTLPSEIGAVRAIEFAKADMVLTLSPHDGTDVDGKACVLSLQTADAR